MIPGYDPYKDKGKCRFDDSEETGAGHAIAFFHECLTHVKGELAGKPFILEPWEQAIIANIFGWKRPDGTRRYREVFVYVPRKNGKSLLIAGIGNRILFGDGEMGAEIYAAAADREQAALVWEMAKRQIMNNEDLENNSRIYMKSIVMESMGSSFKPISRDANTKHGYNTHCALIDELHAHKDPELVDVLVTSTGARRQPLIVYITTADYQRESICNRKYEYACKVRDGIIKDPYFLPVIYEAQIDDDWESERIWKKANPNYGISISKEYMQRECQRAKDSPYYQNTFKRLHLNIRTQQDIRWLSIEKWKEGGKIPIPFEKMVGKPCYSALDLASTADLSSFGMFFPKEITKLKHNWMMVHSWIPEETALARQKKDRVPYIAWADQGFITLTEGNVADYDVIRRDINNFNTKYQIKELATDPWNATQITTQLEGDGFDVIPFRQGFGSLSAPSKEFEKMILSGDIQHGGNPVLLWAISNVMAETDAAGNIKPSKKKSSEKIDPVMVCVMAIARAIVDPIQQGSIYEEREIEFL